MRELYAVINGYPIYQYWEWDKEFLYYTVNDIDMGVRAESFGSFEMAKKFASSLPQGPINSERKVQYLLGIQIQ